MGDSSRLPQRWALLRDALRFRLSGYHAAAPRRGFGEVDPRLSSVGRQVRPAGPGTRLSEAMEMLRMSPYRLVPVVADPDDAAHGQRLVGVLTEGRVVRAMLAAETAEARAALRSRPVGELMEPPPAGLPPSLRASEAALRFDDAGGGVDTLPITDASGALLGLVSRSDLVQEMMRPFRPPVIGGMATPVGVYLTTGQVSGGVGTAALVLTGMGMSLAYLLTYFLGQPLGRLVGELPEGLRPVAEVLVTSVAQLGMFLLLIRLSPMAGYHAAEHQVVHAVEKGEPLLVRSVRQMPRVHPRCGTNLVAGGMLFYLLGTALSPLLGDAAYLVSGLVALSYWRALGAWLQRNLTTRPATDAQIESGIAAANALLARHNRDPYAPSRPLSRLWRMGFLQILFGFTLGCAVVFAASRLFPPLHAPLQPYLQDLRTLW